MELTNTQRKDLRIALIAAFPKQPELGLMLEDELGKNLNEITQSQPTYQLIVQELVKWAESNGKLFDLVIGASRSNSGNPELQQFVTNEIDTLLNNDFGPITQELNQILWRILQRARDFAPIATAAFDVLPEDVADSRQQAIDDLRNQSLNLPVKLYILLRLLLHDFRSQHNLPNILKFVDVLRQQQGLEPDILQHLGNWIQSAEKHCQCTSSSSNPTQPPTEVAETTDEAMDAYLMVMVGQSRQEPKKYRLNAFLQLYRYIKGEQVLQEEIPMDDGGNPSEKGILCRFEQVPENLVLLVEASERKLNNRNRRKRLHYRTHTLTIEFFLPFQYLGECVDHWQIPVLDDPIPLGRQYRVTVRSYDRILLPSLLNALELAWENFQSILRQQEEHPDVLSYFEPLCSTDNCNWRELEVSLTRKMGLKMTCAPPQSETERNQLFKSIIRGSVPLALWTRCCALETVEDWSTVLDRFITWDSLRNIRQLLELVKAERMTAYAAGEEQSHRNLGYHLSVLWDDPNRIPPLDPLE